MKDKIYTTTFDVHLPATRDRAERFVETIEVDVYQSFGEEVLTPESSEKIERVKARHLGLIKGSDIKKMRNRLGLSQKRLTNLLQCGEKMLSHWENGHGQPTGLSNTILRLLDEGYLAPASLEAVQGPRTKLATGRYLNARHHSVVHYDFTASQGDAEIPGKWDETSLSNLTNS